MIIQRGEKLNEQWLQWRCDALKRDGVQCQLHAVYQIIDKDGNQARICSHHHASFCNWKALAIVDAP